MSETSGVGSLEVRCLSGVAHGNSPLGSQASIDNLEAPQHWPASLILRLVFYDLIFWVMDLRFCGVLLLLFCVFVVFHQNKT